MGLPVAGPPGAVSSGFATPVPGLTDPSMGLPVGASGIVSSGIVYTMGPPVPRFQ